VRVAPHTNAGQKQTICASGAFGARMSGLSASSLRGRARVGEPARASLREQCSVLWRRLVNCGHAAHAEHFHANVGRGRRDTRTERADSLGVYIHIPRLGHPRLSRPRVAYEDCSLLRATQAQARAKPTAIEILRD